MRFPVAVLSACVVLAACGGDAAKESAGTNRGKTAAVAEGPPGAPAVLTKRLDFASCLAEDIADEATQSARCPSFALLSLDYMSGQCNASGGKLKARHPSQSWSLDVDGDASAEVLVDLAANFDCEGALGVFSCGSAGCPFLLYKKRGDTWVELGDFHADDGPGIEVLPVEKGKYATLRGGCTGLEPCSELTHYEWNGTAYKKTWIAFKGHPVDVTPDVPLMKLTKDSAVIDAPGKRGQVLDEYPAGTAVIVIGAARDSPYSFVSPCNACRRGFVETALLTK